MMTLKPRGALISALLAYAGCNGGGSGGTDPDTTGEGDGGPPCVEEYPDIHPSGNPEFAGVISGEDFSVTYNRVVRANIARSATDGQCCQDYILSGSSEFVRIAFGASGTGLVRLADRADQTVSIGSHTSTARDLAVADINSDNRNDILVLRSDGKIVVALGLSNPLVNGPYFSGTSSYTTAASGITATNDMDLGDIDDDGDLDVVITATSNSVLYLKNNGSGVFGTPGWKAAGLAPQRLDVGPVDGDDDADLVVSGNNGKFSYLEASGSSSVFATSTLYTMWGGSVTTTGMPIVLGKFCPGHSSDAAVVVGYYDGIRVACGDGSGDFASVVEPHGDTLLNNPTDYMWELEGGQASNIIVDLALWEPHGELFVLDLHAYTHKIRWLTPGLCSMSGGVVLPIAEWGDDGAFASLTVDRNAKGDTTWATLSSAGAFGLTSVQ
jgi:hypothetical protein